MTKTLSPNHLYPINLKLFWFLSLVLILVLLGFYVFQVISMNERAFTFQAEQNKIEELSEQNKALEIEFSQTNSLERIETLVKNLNFEKVGNKIHYIRVLEGAVAKK